MKQKYTFRKFINDVHLWLGLASGLVLFVVCLSGTIYTFRAEIERWVSPEKYYVKNDANAKPLPADTLVAQLERKLNGKVVSLQIPADASKSYQVGIKEEKGKKKEGKGKERAQQKEAGAAGGVKHEGKNSGKPEGDAKREAKGGGGEGKGEGGARPKNFFVNPYTAEVVGKDGGKTADFFMVMMRLHRWLLLENSVGKVIVGVATMFFTVLIISGLVLWFPVRIKAWKQGLKIKFSANWKRVNHDLHNTLGFYSAIFLLVMALTGLCWSFEWYKNGVSTVMGAKVFGGRGEKPLQTDVAGAQPMALSSLIQNANTIFPYTGDYRISLPADSTSAVVITKTKTGFFALAASDKVQLSQYTGEALKTERFSDKRLNEQIVTLIRPLHTGEVAGTFSKIIYFLACLIATSLPVTGTIIWLNKLKKKTKRKKNSNIRAVTPKEEVVTYKAEIGI